MSFKAMNRSRVRRGSQAASGTRDAIVHLQAFYRGFYLEGPVGNNGLDYWRRRHQRLYVAPLIEGSLADVAVGTRVAFSRVENGREVNACGLRHFVHLRRNGRDVFVFDNHNHAFFFWVYAVQSGRLAPGARLVHVDRHSDMWPPPCYLERDRQGRIDLQAAFDYTNYVLNVGTFIKPALALGLFSEVEIIDAYLAFDRPPQGPFVLDLDLDVFAEEDNGLSHAVKLEKVRALLQRAELVTVATSPGFVKQERALRALRALWRPYSGRRHVAASPFWKHQTQR